MQYIREEMAERDRIAQIKFENEKTAQIEREEGIKEGKAEVCMEIAIKLKN